jgi:hypothetical protein
VKDVAREKAREEARKKLEDEMKKPVADRKLPEYGSDKDFQLPASYVLYLYHYQYNLWLC